MSEPTHRLSATAARPGNDPPFRSPKIDAAEAAVRQARAEHRKASWRATLHAARLLAARVGIAWWVLALIAGTLFVAVCAAFVIFTLRLGATAVLLTVFLGYLAAGVAVYLGFRDRDGENDETRVHLRLQAREEAETRAGKTRAALEGARESLAATIRSEQEQERIRSSEAFRRKLDLDRLLAVDREHLTADEFTQHVAEVFRFLGFHAERFGAAAADTGVSMIVYKEKIRIALHVKAQLGTIDTTAIQQVVAGMAQYRCHRSGIITLTRFTPSAVNLASNTGCLLIGAEQFPALIRGEILL